jgi:signal peptidase I
MKRITNIAAVAAAVLLMLTALMVYVGPRLGYQASVVVSDSMSPTIGTGAMVVAEKVAPEALKTGDIITYKSPLVGQLPICHRIEEVVSVNPPSFQTKGDNPVEKVDSWVVPAANVLGRVVFQFPIVGYYVEFISSKVGLLVGLIVPGLLFIYLIFRALWKELVRYIRSTVTKGN